MTFTESAAETLMLDGGPIEDIPLKKIDSVKVPFCNTPTDLSVLLVRHETADDLPPEIDDIIAAQDVLLLESAGWTPYVQETRNRVSQGDKEALEADYPNTFYERMDEALFASGVAVRICDIPRTKANTKKLEFINTPFDMESNSDEEMMRKMTKYYDQLARNAYHNRDKHMLRNIYPLIEDASTERQMDTPVKALFIVGALHQAVPFVLAQRIKQEGRGDTHSVQAARFGNYVGPGSDLYLEFLQGKPYSLKFAMNDMLSRMGHECPAGSSEEEINKVFEEVFFGDSSGEYHLLSY